MEIVLASHEFVLELRSFFGEYVDLSNDGVYSREFVCPDGIRAAARRGQMMAAIEENQLVAACRFYKKKSNIASLYQFAIREGYRGNGMLIKMLEQTGASAATARCPENAQFNDYYCKTGWSFVKAERGFVHWEYSLHSPQLSMTVRV